MGLLGAVAIALVALIVGAELVSRFALGLGNPPLWQLDDEIEYLPRAGRAYVRFGNRISFNAWHMRCRELPAVKDDPHEYRVVVVGDSIVYGGAAVDQDDLATTLLERWLAESLHRPVTVANISAASWGPPNQLAYLERFGLFDADVVVLVLNSADYADAPTFGPLPAGRPQRRPVLALQELLSKYGPRLLRRARGDEPAAVDPSREAVDQCMSSLRRIIEKARAAGADVLVAQYLTRVEVESRPLPGHGEIKRVVTGMGIEPVQLDRPFAAALASGETPYADGEHPTALGQRLIAEQLLGPVRAVAASGVRAAAGGSAGGGS